jgi:hypothetical protein
MLTVLLAASTFVPLLPAAQDRAPEHFSSYDRELAAVAEALRWLAEHQSEDGSWDSDGFDRRCRERGADPCWGAGDAQHDVGATGLALLAFLGDGNTTREGPYKDVVAKGIKWLKDHQDPDTGLIGERVGHAFLYGHAIATTALCEAYYFTKSPLVKRPAQAAASYLASARNPYGAWRYDVPPSGDNDSSVTSWCLLALFAAKEADLAVDERAFAGGLAWFDEVTDPRTGRCGYDAPGSGSSRIQRVNDHFPPDAGENLTAASALCRVFLGQLDSRRELIDRQAALLRAEPPRWDPDGTSEDFVYWFFGSHAMFQLADGWEAWHAALSEAALASQRRDGDARGSWDPVDAWGPIGGRVYATSLLALSLESPLRYARVKRD